MILSFLIAINIDLKTGKLDNLKWEWFLKGCGVVDREEQEINPLPEIISEFNWDLLNLLENRFDNYEGLTVDIKENKE